MGYRIHSTETTFLLYAYSEDMERFFDDPEMANMSPGLVLDDPGNLEAFVIQGNREQIRKLGFGIITAARPGLDADIANALAAHEELMAESEASEEIDTGDAINVMADLALVLARLVSDIEESDRPPVDRYQVKRNGSAYAEFGMPEQAEEYRAQKLAEQPDNTWTVEKREN